VRVTQKTRSKESAQIFSMASFFLRLSCARTEVADSFLYLLLGS